jgi:hypothetical protein
MFVSLLTTLALAAPQAAQTTTPAPAPVPVEKPVCRNEVPTGSTLPKRICHTKAQWAAIGAANASQIETVRQRRGGTPPGN